jgi:hypothetical protein
MVSLSADGEDFSDLVSALGMFLPTTLSVDEV